MARYILDVNQERGITVVLIEHDMGVVMDISDRVVVLDRGRKIADGTPAEVQQQSGRHRGLSRHQPEGATAVKLADRCRHRHAAASCCARNAAAVRRAARHAREGPRHLADLHLAPSATDHVRDFALGLAAHGLQARRQAVGPRRQPAAALLGAARGAGARRHGRAALPGLRSPASSPTCSTTPRSRWSSPRTRSRSTRSCRCATELPSLRLVVYDDPRGMSGYERADLLKSFARCRGGRARLRRRRIPAISSASSTQGRADDVAADRLHVGHHRADRRACCSATRNLIAHGRELRQRSEPLRARRQLAVLPADGAGSATRSSRSAPAWSSAPPAIVPESPETVQRDLRELGPDDRSWRRRGSGRTC